MGCLVTAAQLYLTVLCQVWGAWYLLLNYLTVSLGLGLGVGPTLDHYVPDCLQGLELSQLGMQIQIPETGLVLKAGGVDLKVIRLLGGQNKSHLKVSRLLVG